MNQNSHMQEEPKALTTKELTEQSTDLFAQPQRVLRKRRVRRPMKQVFIQGEPEDTLLFPHYLSTYIPAHDVIRYVKYALEGIDTTELYSFYKGGGRSAFDPLLLLKIIIGCYCKKIYTCRTMARACRENVCIMWIGEKIQPDFRTLGNFRSGKAKDIINKVFANIVKLLIAEKYLDERVLFTDGTRIQADANQHKVIWKKKTATNKERTEQRIEVLLENIEKLEQEETALYGDKDLPETGKDKPLTPEEIREKMKKLEQELKIDQEQKKKEQDEKKEKKQDEKKKKTSTVKSTTDKVITDKSTQNTPASNNSSEERKTEKKLTPEMVSGEQSIYKQNNKEQTGEDTQLSSLRTLTPKEVKKNKKIISLCKTLLLKEFPKHTKYTEQLRLAGTRSGFSATDTDATVFRTKDGQFVPSYNMIVSTNNQYVVYVLTGQNPGDHNLFIPHMNGYFSTYGQLPQVCVADGGYGSEVNFRYCRENNITPYMRYTGFYAEKTKQFKEDPSRKENFTYNEQEDTFTCTQGRVLSFVKQEQEYTNNTHITTSRYYRANSCDNCPIAEKCKKQQLIKEIKVRPELQEYKREVNERLSSPEGKALYKQRSIEPETFNGDIKHNMGFRRTHLRGLEKVSAELTIVALAHNIRKMAAEKRKNFI